MQNTTPSSTTSKPRRGRASTVIVLGLSALTSLLVAGCDDDLIDDANFHMWCGDELCSWKLETGHIRQAPTWHKNDHGVELIDTPTTISQELKKTASCIVFSTIADVDATAQVTIGMDFTGDGVVDYEQPIAASGFREVQTQISAPRATSLPRVYITKKGQGRAVLAQLRLQSSGSCTAPPLRLKDRALGDACAQGTQGEPSECKSGVCCGGICSECCVTEKAGGFDVGSDGGVVPGPNVACPNGGTCERRAVDNTGFFTAVLPLQCDPGKHLRRSGEGCLADDDCASNSCDGASSIARKPELFFQDAGAELCPSDFPDAGAAGCTFLSVRDGRCR